MINGIYGSVKRRFSGMMSRSDLSAKNNLSIIRIPLPSQSDKRFRNPILEMYDAYYENRQYNHLAPWDSPCDTKENYIPVRQRKPRITVNFSKLFCTRLTSKLVGDNVFPRFSIEGDPETEEYLKYIIKASKVRSRILEPMRRMLNDGSSFLRYYFINGSIQMEAYLSKYVYPEFDSSGQLKFVKIQYVYEDLKDLDENGKPKQKWYRMDLSTTSDILYNNPEFSDSKEDPQFEVVSKVEHNLGFVQGEWFRTMEKKDSPDGESLICEILDFIDELNYSFSQSSQAVGYNQDPQILVNGMDEEELDTLIRSATKAWNMGREGKAEALETTMSGVQIASELRDKMRLNIQDIARIVLLDPDKIVGSAQSAKAMEVLHGPMIELINELRPVIADSLISLVLKIAITNLKLAEAGTDVAVQVPKGWTPESIDVELMWNPIFSPTMQDLQQKISIASTAVMGNLLSRETALKFIAKDFGIDNVEEELQRILEQPQFNTFGSTWAPGLGQGQEEGENV
jgi:hypothetical protein